MGVSRHTVSGTALGRSQLLDQQLLARRSAGYWGALVMGAIRLYRVRDAILFAAGLSLLANSRPLEVSVLCISAIILLIIVFGRKNPTGIKKFVRHIVSVPVVSIACLTILFMG